MITQTASSTEAIIRASAAAGARPDPFLTISQWADKYRTLSQRASSEPGQWRTDRTPYLREIMDCLSPTSLIERTVFMKGAQIGGTECGNNWIGYVIHQAPGPMMAVQPTVEMAKRNSKQRVDPLIEESEVLRNLVHDPRSRDSGNTVLAKEFPGGVLVMTGANSAIGLRSMAARYLFLDEVDGYPGDVDGEGDPINLAMARTRTFARRKVFLVSTPKITGMSRIEAAFEESDKRYFAVPCPICREFQVLKFPQLRWPKGEAEKAVYICEHCGQEIQNHQKQWMLPRGQWRATAKGDGKTAGFHLSSMYSPVGWFSWGDAAKQFEQAQKNPSLLQVFVNTVLGETWTLLGEAPDWKILYDRREAYKIGLVPRGGIFVTAGADVQRDRIEVEVVAWGRGKESWSIDYRVFEGDTARPQVWEKLTGLLNETFTTVSGLELPIIQLAVDSGYATNEVYEWARRQGHRVLVIKGDSRAPAIIGAASPIEVGPLGVKLKRGVKVWPVNSGMAKEELYRWLRLERPTDEDLEQGIPFPPGYCHFPRYSEEYFKQITAEQLVAKLVKGYRKLEWQKMRDRNEALDCRVYARAAAARVGLDRFQEKHWKIVADRMGLPVASAPRPAPQVQAPPPTKAPAPAARRGRRVSGRFGM
ncbi:MAG TPA: phage terminase large subunit family protein [Bryobacteraceae bacterium]|nr:phage terminase large subunit family protein [Bryobacteraceae bacterium]